MKRVIKHFVLLTLLFLLPEGIMAQDFEIFAKQGMVVRSVRDRNDRPLSDGAKTLIHQGIVDALTASDIYEVIEVNEKDARAKLAEGQKSPANMRKMLCKMATEQNKGERVDYVVETEVSVSSSAINAQDLTIFINASLYRASTETFVRAFSVESKPSGNAIVEATAQLVENLLGVRVNRQTLQFIQQKRQPSAQQQPQIRTQPQYYDPQPPQSNNYSYTPTTYVEDAGCGLGMKMVYVEGGSFQMGATSEQSGADSDERPVHTVRLGSYYIAECEVTQAQWQKVVGTTIYQQRDKADTSWPMRGIGDDYPMYYVSWEEARIFCRELSVMTGKTYLLPTEAQWEYAARGGNKSHQCQYSGSYSVDAVAWYVSNSNSSTHPVKQLRANELGLYDMSGNVVEWCSDWYGSYSSAEQNEPTGPSSGQSRVMRGGSWFSTATSCRVASRSLNTPSYRSDEFGFRVVCLP